MSFFRVNSNCNGCLACVQNCPANALRAADRGEERTLLHNMSLCARCGHCWRICPQKAIEFNNLLDGAWDEVASMKLVRCMICSEPLYTLDFQETVAEKVPHDIAPLCPDHRQTFSLPAWKHLAPASSDKKGAQK